MSTVSKFTAVFGSHQGRIISTLAQSREEAREEIRRQLDRPGRKDALVRWIEDGEQMLREAMGFLDQEQVGDVLDVLSIGEKVTVNGLEVERLAGYEVETFSVNGSVVCFIEAVDLCAL